MTINSTPHRTLRQFWGMLSLTPGAALDSLPFSVAILDRRGRIIRTNQLWRKPVWPTAMLDNISIQPGANYLHACGQAAAAGLPQADDFIRGVQGVCDGSLPSFDIDYLSPLPGGGRWFSMTVSSLSRGAGGVVITHRDVSDLKVNFSGRFINAQEEERSRVARELHDNLSQKMALLSIDIERLAQLPLESADAVRSGLYNVLNSVQEISSEMHRMSYDLHPSKLDRLGLAAATLSLCNEISRQQSLHVECNFENVPDGLPADVALCLYRVIQEALQNVIKHSGSCSASVNLRGSSTEIKVRITDEGVGIRREPASSKKYGLGLISMRERLRLVGGTISIESQPMHGTRIDVAVPLKATNSASAR